MAKVKLSESTGERRNKEDRRAALERRKERVPVAAERRVSERRKVPRRRQIDPTTCERDYSADEIEFMHAMDAYKRTSGRMFPTCSEILEVLRGLGYTRQENAGAVSGTARPGNSDVATEREGQEPGK